MKNNTGYEQEWQKVYSHDQDPIREHLIYPLLEKEVSDLVGKKIIDIGCGNGSLVKRFATKQFKSACCLDRSDAFLSQAKKLIKDSRVEFKIADIKDGIPFSNECFDEAFSIFVLNEIHDIQSFLLEISRIIKTGGHLHIITIHPFIVLHAQLYELYTGKKNEKLKGNLDYKNCEKLSYYFTIADAKSVFYQHSFENVITSINNSKLQIDKLIELRTDNSVFEKYAKYWKERFLPKYLYIKLKKLQKA